MKNIYVLLIALTLYSPVNSFACTTIILSGIVVMLFLGSFRLFGQMVVSYSYDACGNRILRQAGATSYSAVAASDSIWFKYAEKGDVQSQEKMA
jgi:hypothetical protein